MASGIGIRQYGGGTNGLSSRKASKQNSNTNYEKLNNLKINIELSPN